MHDAILGSGRDTFLVAIPFLGMLVVCFFRLDERFAAPKKTGRQPRPPCGVDLDGRSILCDPDGRPWNNPRLRPFRFVFSVSDPCGTQRPLGNGMACAARKTANMASSDPAPGEYCAAPPLAR
jgi:hypothetical protein